jgi:phosphoglycolate phosphatase-like HAD superfamily hydrolase
VLVLFDIDGTLLTGDGVGLRALRTAGCAMFGPEFRSDGVSYAGRLDPLITEDLLAANRVEATAAQREELRRRYAEALAAELEAAPVRRLTGALELVDALAEAGVTLGVLTGNYPETGAMKLASAEIPIETFEIRVWGDDSPEDPPHRDHLPKVAAERWLSAGRSALRAESVVIVGDTPGDVRCALTNGHACLAVATGRYDADALKREGATRTAADLRDTAAEAAWILETLELASRGGD